MAAVRFVAFSLVSIPKVHVNGSVVYHHATLAVFPNSFLLSPYVFSTVVVHYHADTIRSFYARRVLQTAHFDTILYRRITHLEDIINTAGPMP